MRLFFDPILIMQCFTFAYNATPIAMQSLSRRDRADLYVQNIAMRQEHSLPIIRFLNPCHTTILTPSTRQASRRIIRIDANASDHVMIEIVFERRAGSIEIQRCKGITLVI